MARTKDENLLVKLYEVSRGDTDAEVDASALAARLGYRPNAMKTILHGLAQANFIRKQGYDRVQITEKGAELARELQGQ